jgi:Fe-S-cluster-containing dehydrogenase component
MNEQSGFIFHKESCIQCHGCEMACKMWRRTEPGVAWRRVLNIWQGQYPSVTCLSLSLSCLHCDDPACVAVCPTGALTKRDTDGAVLVERSLCAGCRACLSACPYDAPQFGADGLMQKCDMCAADASGTPADGSSAPPCVRTCPTGALELAVMTREQKKELEGDISVLYQMAK